jgi:hypothetical protein
MLGQMVPKQYVKDCFSGVSNFFLGGGVSIYNLHKFGNYIIKHLWKTET